MALPAPSSPLSSPPSQTIPREVSTTQRDVQYRPAKGLPFELAQNVQTYFEEGLFTQAFSFLLSITGNSASPLVRLGPVTIPPPSQLALTATLVVHPTNTSRTDSREKWNQANAGLRLLRLVHTLVGPINADFTTAFSFRKFDFRFSRRSNHRLDDDDDGAGGEGDNTAGEGDLNTPYARSQSLWARAEDFWQLVGWAFNCACHRGSHAERWSHYQLLLEFLIDVLEEDWHLRNTSENTSADESLLWQYIELSAGGHARARRILRAIFADGSQRSLSEFREIFPHELKGPRQEDGKIKMREVDVNIDQDIYGDYSAQDDLDLFDAADDAADEVASTGTGASGRPSKRLRTRTRTPSLTGLKSKSSAGSLRSAYSADDGEDSPGTLSTSSLGGPSCLSLRLRLLKLLTHISSHYNLMSTSPTTFPDLEELYTLFVEFIRPLPLPVFAHIVLPTPSNPLGPTSSTWLCEALLQRLLETSAPSIRSHVLLSGKKLEQEYLPFAASKNSVDANARVSILLESLTRCLARTGHLNKTESLARAARTGVEKRVGRMADLAEKKGGSKKKLGDEGLAWEWLVESGERITLLIDGLALEERIRA
ncbi:uncharacterized protein Z520_11495 [Fonsecaea multimorphosa CBS 102226]|uniref:Uncharacterized protein n=1 Tax=Fonsecaea multimorphosa CBS 102226 TaxID=1442371 RepID=A0A0D2JI24_9EURO|nr:uncharacterized protein Z520_11495 [Fonsecaea multimorphosa CBS 102226]KIX92832.1 hypothetical protein Z520_11495 [Fonsecaea multimorphosa CBS 102226]OAL18080.1 hypothetical protein AYO22_11002 [Fonsecaea multimorphosa]